MDEYKELNDIELTAEECACCEPAAEIPVPVTETPAWPEPPQIPPVKKKKSRRGLKLAALILCCSLFGGVLGVGGTLLATGGFDRQQTSPADPAPHQPVMNPTQPDSEQESAPILGYVDIGDGELMSPAEVYAANVHATVGITTSITVNYWGYQSTAAASGSGFIVTEDGYILTNYHVVEDSNSITVSLYDGTKYSADLIGYDASNDIAVLKVDATDLPTVTLGNSDQLNVGDPVVAIGNPLGELTFSLTFGMVSAKDRTVTISDSLTMDLIQTDCAINSGNSGGALFNLYGQVIGITNAKYSSSSYGEASIDNIAFAIPVNDILPIVESIIQKGYISKSYIGVMVGDVSREAQAYGVPAGAAIDSVSNNGPADEAGILPGDIITAIDGKPITSGSELVDAVGPYPPGATISLDVYRKGQTLQIQVVTREKIQSALPEKEDSGSSSQQQQQQQGGSGYLNPWEYFFGGGF